jgi:hypothetical protein
MAEAVMSADATFAAARQFAARRYAIGFAGPDGVERTVGLLDALQVAFEAVPPVRSFARYRGQRSNTGLWWSASTGGHVGFESWPDGRGRTSRLYGDGIRDCGPGAVIHVGRGCSAVLSMMPRTVNDPLPRFRPPLVI